MNLENKALNEKTNKYIIYQLVITVVENRLNQNITFENDCKHQKID